MIENKRTDYIAIILYK